VKHNARLARLQHQSQESLRDLVNLELQIGSVFLDTTVSSLNGSQRKRRLDRVQEIATRVRRLADLLKDNELQNEFKRKLTSSN